MAETYILLGIRLSYVDNRVSRVYQHESKIIVYVLRGQHYLLGNYEVVKLDQLNHNAELKRVLLCLNLTLETLDARNVQGF